MAQFAHLSLTLPSITTIRRQTALPALVVSPSIPSIVEVESNIILCSSSFDSVSEACSEGNALESDLWRPSDKTWIMYQVLTLDELAVKKHICWDDSHNKFQETCREHNHRIPLNFTSEKELNILCDTIQNDEVHLAMEVHHSYSM